MEARRVFEANEQKPISEWTYSELNTAGWNAYIEQDEATLSELAAEVAVRQIMAESESEGGGSEANQYYSLARSLYRSLENLRAYQERLKNG